MMTLLLALLFTAAFILSAGVIARSLTSFRRSVAEMKAALRALENAQVELPRARQAAIHRINRSERPSSQRPLRAAA